MSPDRPVPMKSWRIVTSTSKSTLSASRILRISRSAWRLPSLVSTCLRLVAKPASLQMSVVTVWGCVGGAGVGGGGARAWPAAGRVARRSGPAPALATFPVQGRSCGLCPFAWGGGWCGAGLRRMPSGRWRPAIGGRPHRRQSRRRVYPAPFFLADCGGRRSTLGPRWVNRGSPTFGSTSVGPRTKIVNSGSPRPVFSFVCAGQPDQIVNL